MPVERTINIILERTFNHPNVPPPPIPRRTLRELLKLCTTEVPFTDMDQNIYVQRDGVGMGSPLGVTFANFFMGEVEEQAIRNIIRKPEMYCRYVDDIFLVCYEEDLIALQQELELVSGLRFTIEKSVNNKIPFLNVLVELTSTGFNTTVYRKPTDVGACMNGKGDAPEQYKVSVIKGFLHRADTLTTDKHEMMLEIKRAKQILINNGYGNKEIEDQIKRFLNNKNDVNSNKPSVNVYQLYYRNFMNSGYRDDENHLKQIIKENIKVKNAEDRIKLVIYYKTTKTRDLIMKNNLCPKIRDLAKTNAVYQYDCKIGECTHLPKNMAAYTGLTTCTISRRLSNHLQTGAILQHCKDNHGANLTRKQLEDSVSIRYLENDKNRLYILEALIIKEEDPEINKQDTGRSRTLKLYGTSPCPRTQMVT